MANNAIYSPQMLWKSFDSTLPLEEECVSESVEGNTVFREVYFSGRQTPNGRVRIFACYGFSNTSSKKAGKGCVLIIPDMSATIDRELMSYYIKQGYSALMVDYRGAWEDATNYTKYPDCVKYANFASCGRALDFADQTAKETSWYEWVAVMKYALSFLRSQSEIARIGVMGIKNGADIGWMLCGTESKIECFASLFGAGWRAYKGYFKSVENEIPMSEERIRFLAGVEAQAYAQNVKCPVFHFAPTNSSEFDVDRSTDTLSRVPTANEGVELDLERNVCYAPRLNDVLDKRCQTDIDLFFAKYLLQYKIHMPTEPKINLEINGKMVTAMLEIDFSDQKRPKKIEVYISEGSNNPAFREWNLMRDTKSENQKFKTFTYVMNGNANFISAFVLVEYGNKITICSKVQSKKIELIPARDKKLIYSSSDKAGSFTVYNVEKHSQYGLFFTDSMYVMPKEGADGISGITSKYGLVCYKVNERNTTLTERSFLKMDVFCEADSVLKFVLMVADDRGVISDYSTKIFVSGACVWQNVMLKCTEFKLETGFTIKDYSKVSALRIESESSCVVNNILLI